MLIAGEASGDLLAAELVSALREELTAAEVDYSPAMQPLKTGLEPRFFGAGGLRMREAGVELALDLVKHSIIGVPSAKRYLIGQRQFRQLLKLVRDRQPDVIIGVDYNYFNLRFAHAVRKYVRSHRDWFHDWQPKLVKFISPQVWASRESRAYQIAKDFDLLLSIFPFEKDWYAKRVPELRVEFIGHPMLDRFQDAKTRVQEPEFPAKAPLVLLLPGSRKSELKRHAPVMLDAWNLIHSKLPGAKARMVLPDESLSDLVKSAGANLEIQTGNLPGALAEADVAISKTGTVAMECAYFGVPAVTLYKTSWATYEFGKRIVKVNSLTMPNLLAGEELFPEFIQNAATPENISRTALELLSNPDRRREMKEKLARIFVSLGGPGASRRAAQAIVRLVEQRRV